MAGARPGLFARIVRALIGPERGPESAGGTSSIPPDSLRPTLEDAPMSAEDVMIAAVATEPAPAPGQDSRASPRTPSRE